MGWIGRYLVLPRLVARTTEDPHGHLRFDTVTWRAFEILNSARKHPGVVMQRQRGRYNVEGRARNRTATRAYMDVFAAMD
jgi:hypothetical protein